MWLTFNKNKMLRSQDRDFSFIFWKNGSPWEHHQLLSRFSYLYVGGIGGDQNLTIFAYFLYLYIDLNNLGWVILFWICAYVIYGWSISQMNSNGCVQALIDLNRVRTSLQPFLSMASKQFLKEATNSILDLQEGNNFQWIVISLILPPY